VGDTPKTQKSVQTRVQGFETNSQEDQDLQVAIEAWDTLPEGVRQSIMPLLRSGRGK
jgi:hypothetical protein